MIIWHQVVPKITSWVYFVLDPISFWTEQAHSGSGIAWMFQKFLKKVFDDFCKT